MELGGIGFGILAQISAVIYFCVILSVIVFVLRQIYRMANAQEQTAQHLSEISRDVKALTQNTKRES